MFYPLTMVYDPLESARARGAGSNDTNRFEPYARVVEGDGWDIPEDPPPMRTEVSVERIRKVITRNDSPDLSFDRSLNPYRGCEHGCVYCFARPSHAFLGLSPGMDFETRLIARPNAPERLAVELSAQRYAPRPIAIGTNTDPYQPIERDQKIMRRCLEVLSEFNHPVIVTTKGTLIERDLDVLGDMAARGLAQVGVSVTSLDAGLSRRLEPRAPVPERRLAMIERIAGAGVPVRLMVSPVIPGLTDHEVERILDAGAGAGATAASWILLRLPFEVATLFRDWLDTHAPGRAGKVMGKIRDAHGGRDYDATFAKRQRGDSAYTDLIAHRFKIAVRRLGLAEGLTPLRCDAFAVPPRAGDQLSLF